jgi:hypothetical protein
MKWSGQKIAVGGVYDGVAMDAYHGDLCVGPSFSSSGLRKIFTESPAHYFVDSYLNPDREEPDEKEAFILGRAAHHLLLGEDDFSTQFVVRPKHFDSWRSDAAKDWRMKQQRAGRTCLLPGQIEKIRGMARSLQSHPMVGEYNILNGNIEQSLVWKDTATGLWLKARPDAIPTDSGDFSDLKTTASVGFYLDRDIFEYRYDMQAAITKWGAKETLNLEMQSFSFVFVETKKPHCVEVLDLGLADIAEAEKDLRAAVDTAAWCLEKNHWFGPGGTQEDARPVFISDRNRENAGYRRDFLRREIARAEQVSEYAAEHTLGAG